MGLFFIIVLIIIIIAIIINGNKGNIKQTKANYHDDKILDQYLNGSSSTSYSANKRSSNPISRPSKPSFDAVDIAKYHESNQIIGSITIEYWKKYHESEGPCSYINPTDADDYIMKFVIYIWNDELDKEVTLKDTTLQGLVSQAEMQFEKWSISVERKKNRRKKEPAPQSAKELHQYRNLIFEVKGLIYRSAQAQLEAVLLEVGDQLSLEEEPDNEKDACAVKVCTLSGECIGYVDKEHCVLVGAMISLVKCCTVIKKSKHQIPYITAEIEFKDKKGKEDVADIEDK